MEVRLNGKVHSLPQGVKTVGELLMNLGLQEKLVMVERNGAVLQREDHQGTLLADGDQLEVVQFVGGG
ncbi:sulfur carrier protein [Marininema mesophilum]|uniref:Sulfur carrier protein n=1 Tax=Marininema mesophilum TaxID=1048340 RepID=A0A1H2R233_9BACL|nr:sulfur carrier protein ThiS [Marininema mesophilum]SDW12739.1 sulfur carrier protein [Marininema mesophilum]